MKDEQTQKLIDKVMDEHSIYCAYNNTFDYYYTSVIDKTDRLTVHLSSTLEPLFDKKR